jgi:hypothetical protein
MKNELELNTLRSFDEWSSMGYRIRKGSMAHWVDGKPKFSRDQVKKKINFGNHWQGNIGHYDHWANWLDSF